MMVVVSNNSGNGEEGNKEDDEQQYKLATKEQENGKKKKKMQVFISLIEYLSYVEKMYLPTNFSTGKSTKNNIYTLNSPDQTMVEGKQKKRKQQEQQVKSNQ